MTHCDHECVLAIMAKAPREGRVKTRLASACTGAQVVELYRALIEDTIALARTIGVSVAVVCPAGDAEAIKGWLAADVHVVEQSADGLAEGLASAFELLCGPARRVIAINGDSPHLPRAVLVGAFEALADHDLVFGPSEDGGFFLVGGTRAHAGLFDGLAMGTESALDALVEQARRLGLTAAVTEECYDVDVPADLERIAGELRARPARAPRTAALLAEWGAAGSASGQSSG